MIRSAILALVVCAATVSACGNGYSTWYGGKCFIAKNNYLSFQTAITNCQADGSSLPSVHSAQENAGLRQGASDSSSPYYNFYIGIVCDGKNFSWVDGSDFDYSNFNEDQGDCDGQYAYYVGQDGLWYKTATYSTYQIVVCQASALSSSPCDSFAPLNDDVCYKYHTEISSWQSAESKCVGDNAHLAAIHDQSTNDFLRRTAVSNGGVGGLHIGLQRQADNYTWTDGSEEDYSNFAAGFPNTAFGDCVAMQTSSPSGFWMNANCQSTQLPFACTKNAYKVPDQSAPTGCPVDPNYYDGQEIYSPGFPAQNDVADCGYYLLGKDGYNRLQVEVVFLEANSCCDSLILYDGLFGGTVLKTLTGYINSPGTYITSRTNAVRLQWNATAPANTRGFHLRFTSVY